MNKDTHMAGLTKNGRQADPVVKRIGNGMGKEKETVGMEEGRVAREKHKDRVWRTGRRVRRGKSRRRSRKRKDGEMMEEAGEEREGGEEARGAERAGEE